MAAANTFESPDRADAAPVEIVRLKNSPENFGLVVDYLARIEPFARYDLGNFTLALKAQLAHGCQLAATRGGRLAGYCGWLPTTDEIARAWAAGAGPLIPAKTPAVNTAAALTIVAAVGPEILRVLIRRTRTALAGQRIYFKRQYAGDRRPARKSSVGNAG